MSAKHWRCFHCGEVFRNEQAALVHFGPSQRATPACQVDAAQMRDLEGQLERYRNEDTDLHRQIASLESEHAVALRRAEENGYTKGLLDGRNLK
jgi:rubredoxin